MQKIQAGYQPNVQYHNDIHGADVMQMVLHQFTTGNLIELAKLDHIDQVATLVAGACHDFNHDGFTNAFHVNTMSDRAIRYHNLAVQENFHAAESFAILLGSEFNFLEDLTKT